MAPWTFERVNLIPLILGVFLTFGLILVFIIAVLKHDVSPYLPFISEAGGKLPESGIFSLVLYIAATIGLITIFLRYLVVEECNNDIDRSLSILNKVALVTGLLSLMGMIVVAAYPVTTVGAAHGIGAFTLFLASAIYGICQTWASYRMCPNYHGPTICRIRLAIILLSWLTLILNMIFGALSMKEWASAYHSHWTGSKTPQDKGFDLLLVAAASEWLMAIFFVLYYFTFAKEFMKVAVYLKVQLLVEHFDEDLPQNRRNEQASLM